MAAAIPAIPLPVPLDAQLLEPASTFDWEIVNGFERFLSAYDNIVVPFELYELYNLLGKSPGTLWNFRM